MASLGRIALGVVGALIGAPFGLSAIGFSIGSAVGGMLFAPDGPKVEGPRLGDTNVSASSLGKIIPEHYGVTRSSGNMIWSAGLKEIKKTEKQGGKGGGGGGTSTTYTYYCSFAMAFGRGEGQSVRRMWADGKLIYDVTGIEEVANDKYKFRFKNGSALQTVDPLIADSLNRRLAGLPDVNEGSQPQSTYTGITELIAQANAAGTPRGAMYAQMLWDRKLEAELVYAAEGAAPSLYPPTTVPTGGILGFAFSTWQKTGLFGSLSGVTSNIYSGPVPNYRFASAFRGITYIVFDDMPLEDFGNRIPNITAEIVWAGAGTTWSNGDAAPRVTGVVVPESGANLDVPLGLMGLNYTTQKIVAASNGYIRRFALANKAEEARASLTLTGSSAAAILEAAASIPPANRGRPSYLSDVRVLGTSNAGMIYATASYHHEYLSLATQTVLIQIAETSLSVTAARVISGAAPSHAALIPMSPSGVNSGGTRGEYLLSVYGSAARLENLGGMTVYSTDTAALTTNFTGHAVSNAGPVVYAGKSNDSDMEAIAVRYSSNVIAVNRLRARSVFSIGSGGGDGHTGPTTVVDLSVSATGGKVSPFPAAISHIPGVVVDINGDRTYVIVALDDDTTGIIAFNSSLQVAYSVVIPYAAPLGNCGLTGYRTAPGVVAFGSGTSIIAVDLAGGSYTEYADATATNMSGQAQTYIESVKALLAWEGTHPRLFYIDRGTTLTALAATLTDVVSSICQRVGMTADEYDVSALPNMPVRGFSITRAGTGRSNLEVLMQAYFIEGVETDWKVKFQPLKTTATRTIHERELGQISAPTGKVNWLESRTPEYSIPAQVNLNYADPLRDYQTGTAHQRRISAPISSMHSSNVENIELPLVMLEAEAAIIAERILYQSWMYRDASKTVLNWTHADLDPGDVVNVQFNDGRVVTDRLIKTTLGANFELELESIRAGDPVNLPSPSSVIPTGSVPSTVISRPVPSRMFAFDIPLLYDYHSTGGSALRYYMALGADSDKWRSGSVYLSWDNATYSNINSVPMDISWGQVVGSLPAPRTLWATDTVNTLTIAVVQDRGDIVSVTKDDILNGVNRALVWNAATGIGEIIQFQDAEVTADGSQIILSNLVRGLRGTDYAVGLHGEGEFFFLLEDATVQVGVLETSRLNTPAYFKGVSAGQLVSSVQPVSMPVVGRALMPWAPSRVRRDINVSGNLVVTWNRRTRIGGTWNMGTGIETVPLNEDSEYYEFYLVKGDPDLFNPNAPTTYYAKRVVTSPSTMFTPADLAPFGLTVNDPIGVAVYQISTQVGRGFGTIGTLAP